MCGPKLVVSFLYVGLWGLAALVCSPITSWAAANGSLSGTVTDPTGAVVPVATITLINTSLKSEYKAVSNGQGFYSFPALPVGHYDLTIQATGFRTQKRSNLMINTDAALRIDATLAVRQHSETINVEASKAATEAQVDTVTTHLGELVTGSQMTALPLNGRSYTDLLPIQPGVTPVSTLLPNSVMRFVIKRS